MSEVTKCGAVAGACICGGAVGHDGPHVCYDPTNCDGSWRGDIHTDAFEVVHWPGKQGRLNDGSLLAGLVAVLGFGEEEDEDE